MKLLVILLTGSTLSASSYAQGIVAFNNLIVDAPIFMSDGTGPGAAGRAQLYLLTDTGYSPVGPIQGFLTASPEATQYIISTRVSIPGIPASFPATLQIRAWVDAPNWETAFIRGESNEVTVHLGVDIEPPLAGLESFTLIPEPSIVTLTFLGAAALLVTRPQLNQKS